MRPHPVKIALSVWRKGVNDGVHVQPLVVGHQGKAKP